MDVKEVLLPGVGLRYEFDNSDGDRIGVIAKRSGDFEIVLYGAADLDTAQPLFRLTEDEADALAQIFGAPRIAERFADLTREVPGSPRRCAPRRSCATRRCCPHPARPNPCARVTSWW